MMDGLVFILVDPEDENTRDLKKKAINQTTGQQIVKTQTDMDG